MRRGWSILEVLVALAVLSCGFLPLSQLLRGTRGQLGQTREMLLLERRALEALDRGAALAARGQLRDLGAKEERAFDWSTPEARQELSVTRVPGRRLLRLVARTSTGARAVTLACDAFDPLASFLSESLPPEAAR